MKTLRIVSVAVLACAAGACGSENIVAPSRTTSPGAVHDAGLGYQGGGGRASATACTTADCGGQAVLTTTTQQ